LVEELSKLGLEVTVLDNLSSGSRTNLAGVCPRVKLVTGDVRDWELILKLTQNVSTVFHLAAMASVPLSQSDPESCLDINGRGTLSVMRACVESGVTRLVYASSSAVYGDLPAPHREDQLPRPNTPYAAIKLLGEHLGLFYRENHNLSTVSLRYFNVYGPRQSADGADAGVIPIFVKALTEGRAPIIYGDGTQTRDFIHVSDVVRATIAAARAPDPGDGVFNVATGCDATVLEVLGLLRSNYPKAPQAVHLPARPGDPLSSRGQTTKATERLGFSSCLSLAEGLLNLCS
jgi:UDP-glucose 4-epimerase